jgi:hypothetical protein
MDTASRRRADPAPNTHDRSTLQLIASIADDTKHLVSKEIELARMEIVEALVARAKGAAAFAAAGVLALMMFIFGGLAGAAALDLVLPAWASRLIIAAAFAVLAVGAVLVAVVKMKSPGIVPEETKRTLKEGEEWAKAQLLR